MRISEAFCKMRLSEYCTSQDVDRAIAVTVDSFVGAQKVSCKKALARAFAKYVSFLLYCDFERAGLLIVSIGIRLGSTARRGVGTTRGGMDLRKGLRLQLLLWLDQW